MREHEEKGGEVRPGLSHTARVLLPIKGLTKGGEVGGRLYKEGSRVSTEGEGEGMGIQASKGVPRETKEGMEV